MESKSIYNFLEGKTILITGVTGFLAKVLVERILQIQPNINKLFLLIRAMDGISATQRLHDEVIDTELFKVLKEKWGANFKSLIAEKVVAVPGDVAYNNLGIKDSELRNDMWRQIDVVVNSAATTNFFERYDVALGVNAFGAVNVVNFAEKCLKVKLLVHLSTAYVCGNQKIGIIEEKLLEMGETLQGASSSFLDINAEKKLVDGIIREFQIQHATEKEITKALKHLGKERALIHGWPTTYLFTKAMGEMLLGQLKKKVDVIILRPTIITSTIKEPFPGWVEGDRPIDSFAVAYGKGKLKAILGDLDLVIDPIPCDMVVDFVLAVTIAHAHQLPQPPIYHIGSSRRNPLTYANLYNCYFNYFKINPWINSKGTPVKVDRLKILTTVARFRKDLLLRSKFEDQENKHKQIINKVIHLTEVYEGWTIFKGILDDANTEKLLKMIRESNINVGILSFDSKSIKWDEYLLNTHFPGVRKYHMKSRM